MSWLLPLLYSDQCGVLQIASSQSGISAPFPSRLSLERGEHFYSEEESRTGDDIVKQGADFAVSRESRDQHDNTPLSSHVVCARHSSRCSSRRSEIRLLHEEVELEGGDDVSKRGGRT